MNLNVNQYILFYFLMNFHMRGKKIIGQLFNFTFFEIIFFINIIIYLVQLMPNKSFYIVYYIW